MEATGPRLIRYGPRNAEINLYAMADIHDGSKACDKVLLARDIADINRDPFAVWAGLGDWADFIIPTDKKRSDLAAVDADADELADLAEAMIGRTAERFDPIKAKGLGFVDGNHVRNHARTMLQARINQRLCDRLKVQNMRYSGWLDLYFEYERGRRSAELIKEPRPGDLRKPGQWRLRLLLYHGFGAAVTVGGKAQALRRLVEMTSGCDLAIMAHLHDELAKRFVRLGVDDDCKVLTEHQTMALLCGSYLRTYQSGMTGYGEEHGYMPTTLGASRARLIPARRRIEIINAADNIGRAF